jgi:hypothetical protein
VPLPAGNAAKTRRQPLIVPQVFHFGTNPGTPDWATWSEWQQDVDNGSNRTPDRAYRCGFFRRNCRDCTETLNNRRSNQGAKYRQAFSDSRLAPMILRF